MNAYNILRWRVYIKYKHEAKWRCLHTLFGSKEEAETYAKSQFAVEAWELRRFQLTEEQLKKLEYVDQFCAEHEADREAEKGPQRLQ
jgi:hypothetical protein